MKLYYTVEELAKKWNESAASIIHYGINGQLKFQALPDYKNNSTDEIERGGGSMSYPLSDRELRNIYFADKPFIEPDVTFDLYTTNNGINKLSWIKPHDSYSMIIPNGIERLIIDAKEAERFENENGIKNPSTFNNQNAVAEMKAARWQVSKETKEKTGNDLLSEPLPIFSNPLDFENRIELYFYLRLLSAYKEEIRANKKDSNEWKSGEFKRIAEKQKEIENLLNNIAVNNQDDIKTDGETELTPHTQTTLKTEKELTQWLRETWINEGKPSARFFFNALKKHKGQKGSPITDYYGAGKNAGIKWQTSAGNTGEMSKKTIQNKVSIFKNTSQQNTVNSKK